MFGNSKLKISFVELLLVVITAVYVIGIRTWFEVCPAMGESMMSCHWAGEVLKATSLLLAGMTLLLVFIPDLKVKTGLNIGILGLSILNISVPGGIINICKNADMACRSNTYLWNIILTVSCMIIAIADIILLFSYSNREKHSRK
ncbi:MAG: DUF4418 family protein [Lachnospiraceae bacterium]|nr:DUF4418 family protein [Lachnospiraceae bacterium]